MKTEGPWEIFQDYNPMYGNFFAAAIDDGETPGHIFKTREEAETEAEKLNQEYQARIKKACELNQAMGRHSKYCDFCYVGGK